jgi:serine O-acetyltransferase
MAERRAKLAEVDPVWARILREAEEAVASEPLLGGMVHYSVLHHGTLERALGYRISLKLANGEMTEQILREICDEAYGSDSELALAARADIVATYERDPACHRFLQPLLFFKGFQAVQAYRVAHWLWRQGRRDLAYFFQMRCSEVFGIDIHPAARIGRGIMIDHAHSIVIGETAVVGDNVSMLHSVTLGGCPPRSSARRAVRSLRSAWTRSFTARDDFSAKNQGVTRDPGLAPDAALSCPASHDRAPRVGDARQLGFFAEKSCPPCPFQASMAMGFSRLPTIAAKSSAPKAPSMTR